MKFFSRGSLGFKVLVTSYGEDQVIYRMGDDPDNGSYTKDRASFDKVYSA